MRLNFGIGVVFIPFVLAFSAQYVFAASYASRLSDLVAGILLPMGALPRDGGSAWGSEDAPTPAMFVADDLAADAWSASTASETGPDAENEQQADQGAAASPTKNRSKSDKTKSKRTELASVHVTADVVLKIANSGRRPSGRSVTAEGRRPAGVQVFGGSALGTGVRDGDIITKVSGVPVTSAGQIVGLVIAARGARQPVIVAEVYRGQRRYILTVEQPYLAGADPPPKSEPAPGSSVGVGWQ